MTTALVLGYSAFDLGLFSDKDPRLKLIKKAIRRDLEAMAEDGAFETHGENWNEGNQMKLSRFKQVDFVKYAYPRYEHKGQLRDYQQFLLENTNSSYLFYDEENETRLAYIYQMMKEQEDYFIKILTFDQLNELAENFSEN